MRGLVGTAKVKLPVKFGQVTLSRLLQLLTAYEMCVEVLGAETLGMLI